MFRDKLTLTAQKISQSRIASPVIIRAKAGRLREVVEHIRPFVERVHEVVPRIMAPEILPFTPYPMRVIPRFDMVASLLPREIIFALADGPYVERIYHDQVMYAFQYPVVPDEGVFRAPHRTLKEITFTSTFWTKSLMGANVANEKGFLGDGVLVSVVDTGASRVQEQIRRVRFESTMKQWRDESGHGSWCTSCVGGVRMRDDYLSQRSRRTVMCEGMAPSCDLLAVKALGYYVGMGSTSDIIDAVDLSLERRADVISMSLGGDCMVEKPQDDPYYLVFEEVVKGGTIPVCAVGNSGPSKGTVSTPGAMPQVLTVGAYDPIKGNVAPFSGRGPTRWGDVKPDVMAPGVNIDSGIVGVLDTSGDGVPSRYSPISGSSMSAPHVAGLITLMRECMGRVMGKTLDCDEVKAMMEALGKEKSNVEGWGGITWQIFEEWMSGQYGVKV